ncbi:chloride channel protein [Uniformispora flossi]|uniref:chloride channel protein n=1 Tax=Uniformispora flossi TaxID=3390723 RepID=UPI003C2CB2E1
MKGRWLPDADNSLVRWLPLCVVVGSVAGLGAAGLHGLLDVCTRHLLTGASGFRPVAGAASGSVMPSASRPWAVPLVAAAGAACAAGLAKWLAPEAGGHGTDAAIHAAHHDPLGMRARVPAVKAVASALTIGTGGSAGTEGPAAQMSAAVGSVVARRAGLSPDQARTAVVVGLGSGVGAIFRAPLGGALLAAEMLYRRGADLRVLPQALVSAVFAQLVFGMCVGSGTLIGVDPLLGVHGVRHGSDSGGIGGVGAVVALAVVGVAAGAAGRLYAACFCGVHDRVAAWARSAPRLMLTAATGGLLAGALGLLIPGVLGTGYGLLPALMDHDVLAGVPWWVVLAIPAAKLCATSVSVGFGGSGGVFGPGLVIGGGVGALAWRVAEPLGMAPHDPTVFVVVGMAACLGPIVRAPIAVLVMAAETIGDAGILGPGIVGVLAAAAVVGDATLYRSQPVGPPAAGAD